MKIYFLIIWNRLEYFLLIVDPKKVQTPSYFLLGNIAELFFVNNIFQVLMATNRIDSLDPALIRPGRIDRKIEFPLPDEKTKRRIFQIHTSRMQLGEDVNIDEFVTAKDDLSGADIKVIFYSFGHTHF